MTQPTVSKQWRKMFKASILPGPPHHRTTIQHICSKTIQRKNTWTQESTHSEMGSVRQTPIQRTVRTAHLSVLMTAQLSVHSTAQNSSDNLSSYLQTIIIAQMLYYCNMVGWICWDWSLILRTLFLQCFETVGWVIWPVKTRPQYDL